MTPADLAEAAGTDETTVKAWETGKQLPPFDLLPTLSAALGCEPETLLYGRAEDASPAARGKALTAIPAAAGALLAAIGAVLIFSRFWEDLDGAVRTVLAFLPLILGGAAGLWAVFSKKTTAAKTETAAALWIAGVIAGNALISAVFETGAAFHDLLFADLLLTLPVVFLLPSLAAQGAALTELTVLCLNGGWIDGGGDSLPLRLLRSLPVFFAAAALGVFALKNELPKPLRRVITASTVAAGGISLVALTAVTFSSRLPVLVFAQLFILASMLIGLKKTPRTQLPLLGAGSVLFAAALLLFAAITASGSVSGGYGSGVQPFSVGLALIPGILLIGGVNAVRKNNTPDETDAGFLPLGSFIFTLLAVALNGFGVPLLLLSAAFGVMLTVYGVKLGRLWAVNVGILDLLAVLLFAAQHFTKAGPLPLGLCFLAAGAALILINRRLAGVFAAREAQNAPGEKEADDDA